jgi:hypothetical protein
MLPLAKQSLDEVPYKLFGAVVKLAGITFSRLAFSYWIDNLGFLLREKLAAILIKPCFWGFQLAGHLLHQLHANKFSSTIHYRAINKFFWRHCRGSKKKNKFSRQLGTSKTSQVFLAPLPGKKKTFARGVSHTYPLLCFKFSFYFIFTYIILSKTQKN